MPPVFGVGVRYQRAPSKRSARAFSTPEVSAPASGCPPMNRLSAPRAAITSRLTEPTSVTAHSSSAASSASATRPGSAITGAAQKTICAPSTASERVGGAESIAFSSRARSTRLRSGSNPVTSASSLARAASPIDPPIRPTPRTAIFMASVFAPLSHSGAEAVERQHGGVPVHAGVRDGLAVDQVAVGFEVLAPRDQEGLHHHADDRAVPGCDLIRDLADDLRLALVVLPAVVVGGVDDDSLRQAGTAELGQCVRNIRGVVVRRSLPATQDHVAVGIPLRVEDRRSAADVDAGEGVRPGGGSHGVHRQLDAAGGAV